MNKGKAGLFAFRPKSWKRKYAQGSTRYCNQLSYSVASAADVAGFDQLEARPSQKRWGAWGDRANQRKYLEEIGKKLGVGQVCQRYH